MTIRAVQTTIWGGLSILAGALMTEGGVQEVLSWRQANTSNVTLGALGAVASAVLLVSGVAFCTRRAFGRKMAILGAVAMIPIHFGGWMWEVMGAPGMMAGVIYPLALLILLGIDRQLGAPARTRIASPPDQPQPSDTGRHSMALPSS